MTVATERTTDFDHLQTSLRVAHRIRVHQLTIDAWEDGAALGGEAVSFYAIQLVIRDVLAAGVRIRRNRIRVRPAEGTGRTPRSESQPSNRPAPHSRPQVVLACSDGRISAEIAERLRASGFAVETAPDGIGCIASVCRRAPQILAVLGRLPWGGTDGVIEVLTEAGRLDHTAVFYAGPEDGLGALSAVCRRRLAGVRFTPDPCVDDLIKLLRNWRGPGRACDSALPPTDAEKD